LHQEITASEDGIYSMEEMRYLAGYNLIRLVMQGILKG
jgi:hypothetical protein